MESEAFVNYLIEQGKQTVGSADTRCHKCEKIEAAEGSLDDAYALDHLHRVYHLFDYTKEDAANERPQRHHIPIRGHKGFQSIYEGTKSYQYSLKKYIEFKDYIAKHPEELQRLRDLQYVSDESKISNPSSPAKKENLDWPKWEGPSNEERLSLARIITKYVKFLHPKIVETLVQDNAKHYQEWTDLLLKCTVDPSLYLWEGSPCSFPGIRRHSGANEIDTFRDKSLKFDNAIALDDNSYPKQLWSYVFRDTDFANHGPAGYQLAHLVDHKNIYGRLARELVSEDAGIVKAIPGLFTCPTNTAYVPTDFLKPTDFEACLRNLLQRKAVDLYSNVCNLLPPGIRITNDYDTGWELSAFEWADPVGTLDHMDDFLQYRARKMTGLFEIRLNQDNA